MSATLPPEDRPAIQAGLSIRYLRDEAVLLLPDREEACALNPQAATVLQLCDGTRTVSEIIAELQSRYLGDQQTMRRDILDCLQRLRELQILK